MTITHRIRRMRRCIFRRWAKTAYINKLHQNTMRFFRRQVRLHRQWSDGALE